MKIEEEYRIARQIHRQKEEECRQLRDLLAWVAKFLPEEFGYSRQYIADEIHERMQQIDKERVGGAKC